MQEILAAVIVAGLILATLAAIVWRLQQFTPRIASTPRKPSRRIPSRVLPRTALPPRLGVRPIEPFERLAERVESALSPDFQARLKERMLAKYSDFSPEWYDWVLLELKRYFLLNLLLRGVPMFSELVDDLWHEMLLFTRDYQAFCEKLGGTFIHHTPFAQRTPMPEERAWFDWVYAQVFLFTPYTQWIWGNFFRAPLGKERFKKLASSSEQTLVDTYFNATQYDRDTTVRQAIRHLIYNAKAQSQQALSLSEPPKAPPAQNRHASDFVDCSALASAFLLSSLWGLPVLQQVVHPYLPDDSDRRRASESGSPCGACGGGCASEAKHSPIHIEGDWGGDGGSDSGCSSGCGSGCGGGCGGGCGS